MVGGIYSKCIPFWHKHYTVLPNRKTNLPIKTWYMYLKSTAENWQVEFYLLRNTFSFKAYREIYSGNTGARPNIHCWFFQKSSQSSSFFSLQFRQIKKQNTSIEERRTESIWKSKEFKQMQFTSVLNKVTWNWYYFLSKITSFRWMGKPGQATWESFYFAFWMHNVLLGRNPSAHAADEHLTHFMMLHF